PFGFIDLSPLPPCGQAETDNSQREEDHAQPEHEVELLRGEGEGAVFGGFGPDADQVFVGAEPVDHVHEEIAVAQCARTHGAVFGPLRGADDDEAAGRCALHGAGGGKGERPLLSLLGIDGSVGGNLTHGNAVFGGAEEFFHRALAATLDLERARHGEGGGHAREGTRNGVGLVLENDGDFGAGAEHVADAREIEHQVLIRGDTPFSEHGDKFGVFRGGLAAADLQHGIEHEEGVTAAFHVLLDGGDDGGRIGELRSADDQREAVLGDFHGGGRGRLADGEGLTGLGGPGFEIDGAGFVVVALQQLLHERVAGSRLVVDRVLAGRVDEAGRALAGFQGPDDGARDLLFGEALGLFLTETAIHQDGDVAPETGGFGLLRLLGRVDELHLQLGGEGGVAVEQIARLGEAGGFVEVGELDFALEAADYLDGLVGEAELLVAGGIVALVVAVGEEVDGEIEDHVLGIEYALTEVFEVGDDGNVVDHLGGGAGIEGGEPTEQPEQQTDEERHAAGHDLVAGGGGDEDSNGQQGGALEDESEVGDQHGFQIGLAPGEEHGDVEHRHAEDAEEERHCAEPLANDNLDVLDGRGEQEFDGAGALLFGDQAHADHGHQEEGDGGGEAEQRANDLLIHVHGLLLAHHLGLEAEADEIPRGGEEAESEDQAEKRHQQIGDGRCEIALDFFVADEEYVSHFWSPSCLVSAVVSCRKISSRLRPTERSSERFQPELTTPRASSARMWRPCRLSISKVRRPSLTSFIMTRLTPETCSRRPWTSAGLGWPSEASTSRETASAPRRRLVRLATESWATSLPWLIMMTRSQECSTSLRMWVLRMMV